MRRFLRYIIIAIMAVVAVSCEVEYLDIAQSPPTTPPDDNYDETIDPTTPPAPTTPIKRRPIVPTTQLPRPRIIGHDALRNEIEIYSAEE